MKWDNNKGQIFQVNKTFTSLLETTQKNEKRKQYLQQRY